MIIGDREPIEVWFEWLEPPNTSRNALHISGGGRALIDAAGSHTIHRVSPYMAMFGDVCNLIWRKSMNNMTPGRTY